MFWHHHFLDVGEYCSRLIGGETQRLQIATFCGISNRIYRHDAKKWRAQKGLKVQVTSSAFQGAIASIGVDTAENGHSKGRKNQLLGKDPPATNSGARAGMLGHPADTRGQLVFHSDFQLENQFEKFCKKKADFVQGSNRRFHSICVVSYFLFFPFPTPYVFSLEALRTSCVRRFCKPASFIFVSWWCGLTSTSYVSRL
jgi:hypothetical protein